MNLHIVRWDEDSALWRTRVLADVDPNQPMIEADRGDERWLAWNTPHWREGRVEYVEIESVAAAISEAGDILLYYRPAVEYWQNINRRAARRAKWLEKEWPTFGEVALEELHNIARAIAEERGKRWEECEARSTDSGQT